MQDLVFLDVECYKNYFLVCFKRNSKCKFYELHEDSKINLLEVKKILYDNCTVGFNSKNYDLPMLACLLAGYDNMKLKSVSDAIITSGKKPWEILNELKIKLPKFDHIDIIDVPHHLDDNTKTSRTGLKLYGARMHTKTLQDLPIEPESIIVKNQHELLRKYCFNDIDVTIELYNNISDLIELRKEIGRVYNLDLRSKSKAQIAESIVRKELKIDHFTHKIDVDKIYKYKVPDYISFKSSELVDLTNEFKNYEFKCDINGKLLRPEELIRKNIFINDVKYTIGLGGIHSNEANVSLIADDSEFILDFDVTSYYPSMIINNNYTPEQLGSKFLDLYKRFYKDRVEAKALGNNSISETFKIVLNGCFGKFGSIYSCLFSPELLFSTTITGQLLILMLIEAVSLNTTCKVVSANTDGVSIFGKRSELVLLKEIVKFWEESTNYRLEETEYKSIHQESVNRYIAVKPDRSVKSKGFGIASLDKNPDLEVCYDAVVNHVLGKDSIESTILDERDIRKFLIVRQVHGGAIWENQMLGKVIRWYYSRNGNKIIINKTYNKVADSDNAKPCMVLPEILPEDIDYSIYIKKSYEILKNLGL